ncbi:MAG: DUF4197 domain-containing protein [Nitrospirae bacterium]|nr:DUF4197 domain-containing protein [Nitrospirota bacterium]NTW66817.1 DUF4197 domain-containing protein [Nitrospirota bacterium]
MRKILIGVIVLTLLGAGIAGANLLDKVKDLAGKKEKDKSSSSESPAQGKGLDTETVAAGLKEALTVGSQNAVKTVSQADGFFKNPAIKIPLPEKVQKVEKPLRKIGLGKQVDEFVLTMNRAAEKAAPPAKDIFIGAIKEMTIVDALNILKGGDTAATEYMRSKTHDKLYGLFKPTVSKAVMDGGVTKAYQQLVDKAKKSRLIKDESLDLDHHVTSKALDGLFTMLGQEEKKIRKDPAAQVTDLLKKVFGK